MAQYQRKPNPKMKHFVDSRAGGPIPVEIIAERDRCHAQPLTLAMVWFGDPKPGRSMLDAKRAQQ
jgi:hypothetical protein